MLPKAEWEYLVRYYKMAKDDVDGLIYFQNSYSVSEEEAAARRCLLERGLIEIHKSENISLDLCELFNLPYLKILHGSIVAGLSDLVYCVQHKSIGGFGT